MRPTYEGPPPLRIQASRSHRPPPTPLPAPERCSSPSPPAASAAATSTATTAPPAGASRPSSWATRPPAPLAAVGPDVSGFHLGDRVTFDSTVYCGVCPFCRNGQVNLCDNRQVVGVSCGDYRRAGAFAEYVTVPARILYHLPPDLSFPEAAMLEAVSVALHAVSLAPPANGGAALVIGAGMIGLLIVQAAHAAGYSRVLLADLDDTRLQLGKDLGANETINTANLNLAAEVSRLTGNAGVDCALEAVGATETVNAAIDSVRKGGTVVLVGNIAPTVSMPLQKVVTRQIRLQGSCASAGEYPQAMALIASGKIRVKPLITATAPLSDGPQWFSRLHAREPNLMKIVLDPRQISTAGVPQ